MESACKTREGDGGGGGGWVEEMWPKGFNNK